MAKKKLTAANLINEGRFQALYQTLSPAVQADVTTRIEAYLQESPYASEQNYMHLKNLFPSMAIYLALQKEGKTKEESLTMVKNAMYEAVQPNRRKMQKLSKMPGLVGLLKWIFPKMEKKFNGEGWNITYPQTEKGCFAFHVNQCIFKTIFDAYDVPELGPVFCYVDNIIYGELPGVAFEREGTLCSEKDTCDFMFKKR